MTAHVCGAIDGKVARGLHHPAFSRLVVADKVDALGLALLGWGKAGDPEQIARLAGGELRNDVREDDVVEGAGDPHHLADGFAEIDIPPDDVTGVLVHVLIGRVGRIGRNLDRRL